MIYFGEVYTVGASSSTAEAVPLPLPWGRLLSEPHIEGELWHKKLL